MWSALFAALLTAAAVLGLRLARQRRGRVLTALGAGVGAVLLLRAIGMEVLLVSDAGYGNGAISRSERFWTLILRNPWFLVGGVAFGLAALGAHRSAAQPKAPSPS